MTGDGVNDAPALKKADIVIVVADAIDAATSAYDIVLTEPGLSGIISAVLTSRAIFQRMKNYTIYAVSIIIHIMDKFGVRPIHESQGEMIAALYLQVSIVIQALIFVTYSRGCSYFECLGLLLVTTFVIALLVRRILHQVQWSFYI